MRVFGIGGSAQFYLKIYGDKFVCWDYAYLLNNLGAMKVPVIFAKNSFNVIFKEAVYFVTPRLISYAILVKAMLSYWKWLQITMTGYLGLFITRVLLVGLGKHAIESRTDALLLGLGYSRYIRVKRGAGMRFQLGRRIRSTYDKITFSVITANRVDLRNSIFILQRLRYPDCYNANGVKTLWQKIKIRKRKRWGVF